jgi:hypothetical protein
LSGLNWDLQDFRDFQDFFRGILIILLSSWPYGFKGVFESGWPGFFRMNRIWLDYPEYPAIILKILIRGLLNWNFQDFSDFQDCFQGILDILLSSLPSRFKGRFESGWLGC